MPRNLPPEFEYPKWLSRFHVQPRKALEEGPLVAQKVFNIGVSTFAWHPSPPEIQEH